jgi:hypothetical protein
MSISAFHYFIPAFQPKVLEVISLVLSSTSRSRMESGPRGSPSICIYHVSVSISFAIFLFENPYYKSYPLHADPRHPILIDHDPPQLNLAHLINHPPETPPKIPHESLRIRPLHRHKKHPLPKQRDTEVDRRRPRRADDRSGVRAAEGGGVL